MFFRNTQVQNCHRNLKYIFRRSIIYYHCAVSQDSIGLGFVGENTFLLVYTSFQMAPGVSVEESNQKSTKADSLVKYDGNYPVNQVPLTHLWRVDSSVLTHWTRSLQYKGCLVNLYCYYVYRNFCPKSTV